MFRLPLFLATLLLTLFSNSSSAATINVECDVTALVNAVTTAEANGESDTLNLANNCRYLFTAANFDGMAASRALGASALPLINSEMTINGNGSIIERAESAANFRHIVVDTDGNLSLNKLSFLNGRAEGGVLDRSPAFLLGSTGFGRGMPGGSIATNGSLTLSQCTFNNNQAGDTLADDVTISGGGGGAIHASESSALLNIDESAFSNNATGLGSANTNFQSGAGGALSLRGASTIIRNSLFDSNDSLAFDATSSGASGVGAAWTLFSDTLVSENNTFSNNGNRSSQSVVFSNSAPGTVNYSFAHETFTAPPGDFLRIFINSSSTVKFDASIFSSDRGVSVFCSSGNDVFGEDNLVDSPSNFSSTACNFQDGVDNNRVDASPNDNLAPLADNGGPTLTHALLAESIALDGTTICPATDQRGVARSQDVCDIGAFEQVEEESSSFFVIPVSGGKAVIVEL